MFILRIISGGQTGADQGGLMAAWDRAIPTGGWCPAEFRTNLGPNPLLEVMGLRCTEANNYQVRTALNVQEADATIIFGHDLTSPGSKQTHRECLEAGKPVFLYEFPYGKEVIAREMHLQMAAAGFLMEHRPAILNVAGNRDTEANASNYRSTRRTLVSIIDLVKELLREQKGDTITP